MKTEKIDCRFFKGRRFNLLDLQGQQRVSDNSIRKRIRNHPL